MQALPNGRPGADVIERGGNNTWAPDVIRVGEKYFLYYSAPGTAKSAIGLLVGKTLDPDSPDYKWEDGGPVVWSDGVEDSNAIDPGVFLDPTTGSLWLMRFLLRLHPPRRVESEDRETSVSRAKAGRHRHQLRSVDHDLPRGLMPAGHPRVVLRRREFLLQHPHGPGQESDRAVSRQHGHRHAPGGGKLFAGSSGRQIGPGHFGLLDLGDGVQKFSCHYEADLDRGGISVLDIRPLLWRDGWPEAGHNFRKARIRSNPRGRAPRSNSPCRACPSAVSAAGVAAAAGEAGRRRRPW